MTNAQKWIATFLGLFLILLVVGRLTKKNETADSMEQYMSQATNTKEADGLKLIKQSGCTTCHGTELQGTNMAPALAGLKEFWTRDKLINYLRNPSSFGTDERFVSYKEKYKNIMMPSYNNIDVKNLGKIADFLLSK
jgi:cytochrome c2